MRYARGAFITLIALFVLLNVASADVDPILWATQDGIAQDIMTGRFELLISFGESVTGFYKV